MNRAYKLKYGSWSVRTHQCFSNVLVYNENLSDSAIRFLLILSSIEDKEFDSNEIKDHFNWDDLKLKSIEEELLKQGYLSKDENGILIFNDFGF